MRTKLLFISAAMMLVTAGSVAANEASGAPERRAPDAPAAASPYRFCYDVFFPEGRHYRNTCSGEIRYLRRDGRAPERDAA